MKDLAGIKRFFFKKRGQRLGGYPKRTVWFEDFFGGREILRGLQKLVDSTAEGKG